MSASDLVDRSAARRIVARSRGAFRGIRQRLTAESRFTLIRRGLLSALLWSGAPALAAAVYLYGLAADQYVSQSKFVVRGETFAVGADGGGTLNDIIEINTSQDTRIAADYIASAAVLPDLAPHFDFAKIYAAPGLDLLAGLSDGASGDERAAYWRRMNTADVDAVSGIVTVETRAFTPEDAAALNKAALEATEAKLNALHRMTLEGAAEMAKRRAIAAEQRLQESRLDIKGFRERYRSLDLKANAASTFDLLSELRQQRISDRAALAVMRARGGGNSPQIKQLEARIAAADQQIADLEGQLTSTLQGDREAASAAIEAYDRLVLRQEMASQYYARTQASLARAEQRLDRRQVYFDVFVAPGLPEESVYPRRARLVLMVLAVAFAIWALGRLLWAGIRLHDV